MNINEAREEQRAVVDERERGRGQCCPKTGDRESDGEVGGEGSSIGVEGVEVGGRGGARKGRKERRWGSDEIVREEEQDGQ